MSRLRNFVFTLNNPTENGGLEFLDWLDEHASYAIVGSEVGSKAGTHHYQGYVELRSQMSFSTVKRACKHLHIEKRRGSQEEAIRYCKKDGIYVETGKPSKQGARGDLDEFREMAIMKGLREVVKTANYQQFRVAEIYLRFHEPVRRWKTEVYWLWGPSGCGKTRTAYAEAEALCEQHEWGLWVKSDRSKWFDGYDGQEVVILDDYRDGWFAFEDLLTLCDRYERRVECKGGSRQFRARHLYVTSLHAPEDVHPLPAHIIVQLLRRISSVRAMGESGGLAEGAEQPYYGLYDNVGHDE